jgi:hypothetical protein
MTVSEGHYGDTNLDGVRFGGAQGEKGFVFYLDDRMTPKQAAAARHILMAMYAKAMKANGVTDPRKAPPGFAILGFKTARINHMFNSKKNHLALGKAGGFDADYLMGIDGKTPVKVSNNWSFNIRDNIKAKTKTLRYHDAFGNRLDYKDTNSNQGKFDWSDKTPVYFR